LIDVVCGARPNFMKIDPLVRAASFPYRIVHTGQHYDHSMSGSFFEQLGLPIARYNLDVGSASHAEQTGRIMAGVEKVLMDERPEVALVQGDTNTVLAAALAASKLHIKVGPGGGGPEKLRSHHARGDQPGGGGSHFRLSSFPWCSPCTHARGRWLQNLALNLTA